MKKYVIGIDYGTLSGRAILLDTTTGQEVTEAVLNYPHAVIDTTLPSGKPLPPQFALQHPQDYLDVLSTTVPAVLAKSGVSPDEVAALGLDFTACTMLPIKADGTPLCFTDNFADEPHAYVKLWKHHAAQPQADRINALAAERNEPWLPIYGGKISSEWALPKILETLECAPEVYAAADRFIEAADWLSLMLTGAETHSTPFAGYKACWNAETGYPSDDFFAELHPEMAGIIGTKLASEISGMDKKCAGHLSASGAALIGLPVGTPIALPQIDAHAAMPALGITGAGELMMIVGTSTCHILNGAEAKPVEGICGYVKDGVIPGCFTYEAGQSGVGDIFDWFVRTGVPADYAAEAEARGINLHRLLREKASRLAPGESGLIALDWLNGNRSTLIDADLTGMILGMTLRTRPEEIYRAWIEATAYGTRMILEAFAKGGIAVNRIVAAGGIAQKDEMMMQIYADVTGRTIEIAGSTQAGARGSAIYAAVAGGLFPSLREAIKALSVAAIRSYAPNPESSAIYDRLYAEYATLYRYFGRENGVMKRLRAMAD